MQGKSEFGLKKIEPTSYVFSKEKKLGRGAFGQVFLGFDQKNKKPIAVKTISFEKIVKSNSSLEAFFQKLAGEIANMQICRSQYIVELISLHKSSKNMYLVCEYCNGGSFKQYLSANGPLSEFQTLHFFKELLKGIKILHEKRVVHRDLKPANILIHNYHLKIGDLGFSKSLQVHEQILTSIVGTPLYMSPQILAQKTYTEKADVWSLGIILFEMLSGEAPWKVNSITEILEKAKGKPNFDRIPFCSEEIKQILGRMLQYEQNNRLSMSQLLNYFLSSSHENQMMDQQEEPFDKIHQKLKQYQQYFAFSLSLDSEKKIRYILEKQKIVPHDFLCYSGCNIAKQFMAQMTAWQKVQTDIIFFFNYFRTVRNRVTYLLVIFYAIYELVTKTGRGVQVWGQNTLGSYSSFMGSGCLIIRYCLEVLFSMLDALNGRQQRFMNSIQENNLGQKYSIFRSSSLSKNLKLLIETDIRQIYEMYPIYYENILIPCLNRMPQTPENQQMVKNLQAYFSNELPLYHFQQQMEEQTSNSHTNTRESEQMLFFWVKNYLSITFNDIKNYLIEKVNSHENVFNQNQAQNLHAYVSNGLLLTKLIYEFSRFESTLIFEDIGRKINIYRRIEYWQSINKQAQWLKKMKEEKNGFLTVEHINSFFSKRLKGNKLAMYNISFL